MRLKLFPLLFAFLKLIFYGYHIYVHRGILKSKKYEAQILEVQKYPVQAFRNLIIRF